MHVQESLDSLDSVSQGVLLSSHCLDRNTAEMFSLWQHVFSSVHWQDTARLATLLRMGATSDPPCVTTVWKQSSSSHRPLSPEKLLPR